MSEEQPPSAAKSEKKATGRPFKKGQSGNRKGRPARDRALAAAEPIALGEASRELVQTLGGQIRALRRIAEERELGGLERIWLLDIADRLIRLEDNRGRLLLAALELKLPEEQRKKLIAHFADGPRPEPQKQAEDEPTPNGRTPALP